LQFDHPEFPIRVIIDESCLDHWAGFRQTRKWHRESGGLLFAPSVGTADGTVRITDVSGPNAADRRRRYSLTLDHRQCLKDIVSRFEQGLHFVGYWHTHPEKYPSMSGADRRAFARNLRDGGLEIEKMIAVIVGNGFGPDSIQLSAVDIDEIIEFIDSYK
jgi:integrative and conjugative element protein (TIGR02256 family)